MFVVARDEHDGFLSAKTPLLRLEKAVIPAAPDYTDRALGTARENGDAVDTPTIGRGLNRTANLLRIDPRREEITADQKRHIEPPEPVVIPVEIVCCIVLLYPKSNTRPFFKYRLRLYRIAYTFELGECSRGIIPMSA